MVALAERMAGLVLARQQSERLAIARENQRTEFKAVDGLGVIQARIGKDDYFWAKIEHSWDCWSDPEFVDWYTKRHAETRIKTTRGTRGQEYAGTRKPLPQGTIFIPKTYLANGHP
jgi:hypothetical protein